MKRDKAMQYAKEKFPELDFGTQIKIATSYIDGCIHTAQSLTKRVKETKPLEVEDVDKIHAVIIHQSDQTVD